MEDLPSTLAVVFLTRSFLFFPSPVAYPVGLEVSGVEALTFKVGTLLAGAFLCKLGLVDAAMPYSFFSTFFLELTSSSTAT